MKWLKGAYNVLFVVLVVVVFSSAIESSFLFSKESKRNVMHFLPQGWAFFTRNPREELVSIYKVENGNFEELNIRNGSAEYFFGLNRKPRVKGYEISLILSEIPPKSYQHGSYNMLPEIDTSDILDIQLKYPLKTIENGIYLIKVYEPIPWAWSMYEQSQNRPTQYAIVRI